MKIELPTQKIKANRVNPKILLLYGAPKVGKTSALSELENCLIIDVEDGSDFLDAFKIKVDSLEELALYGEKILAENRPYKYISIDTATKVEEWCESYATLMYTHSTVGKNFKGNSVLELAN